MGNIFISYAREDKSVALEIYDALKAKGFSLWIDAKNLLPGQEWKIEIVKAIRESDVFIACLSNHSVGKRGYIQAEFKKALEVAEEMPEGEIFIIPVRLDDCEVPSNLSRWHWPNYFDTDEKEKLFKAIQMRIKLPENIIPTPSETNSAPPGKLEKEFEQALRGTYDAARKRGYVATYFLQMLEEHGGKETAKRLLAKSEPQTGLFELWELGLLSESMEAAVLQDKFRGLFTEVELAEAHRRLEELGYFKEGK